MGCKDVFDLLQHVCDVYDANVRYELFVLFVQCEKQVKPSNMTGSCYIC